MRPPAVPGTRAPASPSPGTRPLRGGLGRAAALGEGRGTPRPAVGAGGASAGYPVPVVQARDPDSDYRETRIDAAAALFCVALNGYGTHGVLIIELLISNTKRRRCVAGC